MLKVVHGMVVTMMLNLISADQYWEDTYQLYSRRKNYGSYASTSM